MIALLVTVRVAVAPAAMEGEVKVTIPTLPLHVTAPDAAPDATVGTVTIPLAAVDVTKFPFVAVIFPRVAVRVVDAVREPVIAVFPVALPIFTAPVPPVPMEVTAEPLVFIFVVPVSDVVPTTVKLENEGEDEDCQEPSPRD